MLEIPPRHVFLHNVRSEKESALLRVIGLELSPFNSTRLTFFVSPAPLPLSTPVKPVLRLMSLLYLIA